jgi:hypothetical protein
VLGACSATQPKEPQVTECVPTIEVQKQYIPLPGDLTVIHSLPDVPSHGDNAALLDWAMACATIDRMYEQQMRALKELENESNP